MAWHGARPVVVVSTVVFRHRNFWLRTVVWRCWIPKVSPAFFGVIASALDLPNSTKIFPVVFWDFWCNKSTRQYTPTNHLPTTVHHRHKAELPSHMQTTSHHCSLFELPQHTAKCDRPKRARATVEDRVATPFTRHNGKPRMSQRVESKGLRRELHSIQSACTEIQNPNHKRYGGRGKHKGGGRHAHPGFPPHSVALIRKMCLGRYRGRQVGLVREC